MVLKHCRSALSPSDVLVGDANTGWTTHDAIKVASAVRDLDVYIEQPCRYKVDIGYCDYMGM